MKCRWNLLCRLIRALNLGMLVRAIVVHDQMQVHPFRAFLGPPAGEISETPHAGDDQSTSRLQSPPEH